MACRDTKTMFTDQDTVHIKPVETPQTHTPAFQPDLDVAEGPAEVNRPDLTAAKTGTTHAAIESGKTAETDKRTLQVLAEGLRAKKEEKSSRTRKNTPSLRHRVPQDDAEDLADICVKKMEHEKAAILRINARSILRKGQNCLHAR